MYYPISAALAIQSTCVQSENITPTSEMITASPRTAGLGYSYIQVFVYRCTLIGSLPAAPATKCCNCICNFRYIETLHQSYESRDVLGLVVHRIHSPQTSMCY